MSVRTVVSAQSFVAGPELAPVAVGVARERDAADERRHVRADDGGAGRRRDERDRAAAGRADCVVHGFAVVNAPGPESIVKLISVPAGALTKPAPPGSR